MNRAERRRQEKAQAKSVKPPVYNFTRDTLKSAVKRETTKFFDAEREKMKKEAEDEFIHMAMLLLFSLPMKVLMEDYWKKSYKKRLPEFTDKVLDYYTRWQNDELDIEQLEAELWVYAGIKLSSSEGGKESGQQAAVECMDLDVEVSEDELFTISVEKDEVRGFDRYISLLKNPYADGQKEEKVIYAHDIEELRGKAKSELRLWKIAKEAEW